MLSRLVYRGLGRLAELLPLMLRKDMSKDVEILVLRHQLSVLHRQVGRPHLDAADRGVMCILTRMTPVSRRSLILVKPDTVLRGTASS